MKICPSCGREASVLINNVEDGSQFCPGCAPPSFSKYGILSLEDLDFMKQCGIEPELPDVLRRLVDATKNRAT